ncbi:MAG: hypothetical protein KDC44_21425, partial [Phaeodactylibacter sp.]|nr:hypothetical protein [Phaeodactylibacter sp.]
MRTSIVIAVYLLSISVLHGQLTPPHYLFQAPYGGATSVYLINPNFKRCQLLYTQSDLAQMVAP